MTEVHPQYIVGHGCMVTNHHLLSYGQVAAVFTYRLRQQILTTAVGIFVHLTEAGESVASLSCEVREANA
jgi:hypothetical protein